MSRIRIAVVGAGLIGRHHIQLIRDSGSCELSAIVDPNLGAADFMRGAGVPIYPILTDMLDAERPDGIIVATPNSLHASNGLECVAARYARDTRGRRDRKFRASPACGEHWGNDGYGEELSGTLELRSLVLQQSIRRPTR